MTTNNKVTSFTGKLALKLIEFCYKEKIVNPRITMDCKVTNGEHYRLVFERIDLDDNYDKILKEISNEKNAG